MNRRAPTVEQRGVLARMIAALLLTVLLFAVAFAAERSALTRTARTLALAEVTMFAWLAAAIGNVARLRFFSAQDIGGSAGDGASEPVRRGGAVLQNTLEQAVLAGPTYAVLAFARPGCAPLLLMLAGIFSIGRLLFWVGYARGASGRALGFALTFYPTIGALGVAALSLC